MRQMDLFETEEITLVDGFDDCLIGISTADVAVYDAEAMIEKMMRKGDMTRDDAVEYFYYNIEGAYVGKGTPIYMWPVEPLLKGQTIDGVRKAKEVWQSIPEEHRTL